MTSSPRDLEAFLDSHLRYAWTENLDALVADYAEDAVLFTPDGIVEGRAGIRAFLDNFMRNKPQGFPEDIEFMRKDFGNDTIYIIWSCGAAVPYASETFVLRDGTITAQTFVACPAD